MTKKVMLDAGHGLSTPGKQTPDNPTVKEFTLNQKVVDQIVNYLADYEVEIQFSHDPTGKTDVALATRVSRCNLYQPDLYVSIHHNAYNNQWGKHTGVEVYHHTFGSADDKKVAALLAPKLAANTGLLNRGVKNAEFAVLACKATAILVEGGFMDSSIDNPVIKSTTGQKAYAKAVADIIISFLSLKKKVIIAPAAPSTPSPVSNAEQYIVVKGDTLWSISIKYNLTVDDLRNFNNLKTDVLDIGQVLNLKKDSSSNYQFTYTVVKGDTLYGIAGKYNVTVDQITKDNNLKTTTLSIGQQLIIKIAKKIHIVIKGETLYSIANKYNTTVEAIKNLNKLTSDVLSIGQELMIP